MLELVPLVKRVNGFDTDQALEHISKTYIVHVYLGFDFEQFIPYINFVKMDLGTMTFAYEGRIFSTFIMNHPAFTQPQDFIISSLNQFSYVPN